MPANFYRDNQDLRFNLEHMVRWDEIVPLRENLGQEDCPYGSVEEAVSTYLDMMADPIGSLAAERIGPRAEEIDREGCRLENGQVRFPEGLQRNLQDLRDAQLMGITIPREYGGLEFPGTVYTAAIEVMSRADASLMNFFGLQGGIAETISMFGSKELKDRYLQRMSTGELTGAMALTETEAGSDLGAVQTRASIEAVQDPATGRWYISGTKRFITNGCGDVVLVLARSEDPHMYSGGRGLSFFLVEKGENLRVRRIENKLGIHGSPTCEIQLSDAPAWLIGQRGRGLTRYTSWLMMTARLAVAAQAVGIAEAALQEARKYAETREQFGKKIRDIGQVAAMLANMQVYTEASRALLYATSEIVDLHQGTEARGARPGTLNYARLVEVLTPVLKYYATELANRITYDALQIHGGSGYMKEYAVERLYRDARITNIYEGTSQIQIAWAILRILRGDMNELLDGYAAHVYGDPELQELAGEVVQALKTLRETIHFVRERDGEYRDLVAPHVVDMTADILVSFLLLQQGERWDHKKKIARKFVRDAMPRVRMKRDYAREGELVALCL